MRLFEDRGFAAAAITVFLVGAALFGSLLLLPLYFQIARGLSPLQAGVLMAPQGLGAALGMNRAGRLTDRVGGGPVTIAGLFVLHDRHRRVHPGDPGDALLGAGGLALRAGHRPGLHDDAGDGRRLLDARALAGAARDADAQRHAARGRLAGHGGPRRRAPARAGARGGEGAGPVASAFAHTYWWALAITAVALVPAFVLAHAQRSAARAHRGSTPVSAPANVA